MKWLFHISICNKKWVMSHLQESSLMHRYIYIWAKMWVSRFTRRSMKTCHTWKHERVVTHSYVKRHKKKMRRDSRPDHIYITTDKSFRFHNNKFDEMPSCVTFLRDTTHICVQVSSPTHLSRWYLQKSPIKETIFCKRALIVSMIFAKEPSLSRWYLQTSPIKETIFCKKDL